MRLRFLYTFSLSVVVAFVIALTFYVTSVRSAFNNVVINEIQIAGSGGSQDEFVELYNPTAGAIDITGWRLTRATNTGGDGGNLVASLSGIVPASGYFLVANDDFSGITEDQLYSVAGNNVAADNTVSLYSDAGVTLVDRVGLGNAILSETSPIGQNPPSGGSVHRLGQDTENNLADFEVLEVSTPMNSESSPSPSPSVSPTPISGASPSPSTIARVEQPTLPQAGVSTPAVLGVSAGILLMLLGLLF